MSSDNGEPSGVRKSKRVSKKRKLGDEFIDPMNLLFNEGPNNPPTAKRKINNKSPAPVLPAEEEEINVPTSSTAFLKQIADTVIDKITTEIKTEVEETKLEQTMRIHNLSDIKQEDSTSNGNFVENMMEEVDIKLEAVEDTAGEASQDVDQLLPSESSPYSANQTVGEVLNKRQNRNSKMWKSHTPQQTTQVKKTRNPLRFDEEVTRETNPARFNSTSKTSLVEKELNEEAEKQVAKIREASVKRILENRARGWVSRGGQAVAQDAEISRFVESRTSNPNKLNVIIPKPSVITPAYQSKNLQFVQMKGRTIAVPPQRPVPLIPRTFPTTSNTQPSSSPKESKPPLETLNLSNPTFKEPKLEPLEESEQGTSSSQPQPRRILVPNRNVVVINNLSTPKPRPGQSPVSIRTVTIVPKSMHLDKNGQPLVNTKVVPSNNTAPRNLKMVQIPNRNDGKSEPLRRIVVIKPKSATNAVPITSQKAIMDNLVTAKSGKTIAGEFCTEYKLASEQRLNLHPNQPQILNPNISAQLKEDKVIKEEPMDVKKEPVDDYEINKTSKHNDIPPPPLQRPSVPIRVVIPVDSERTPRPYVPLSQRSKAVLRKPQSPPRVYLGAAEPMKDLDEDSYRYKRFTIKKVESFTARNLRPFGLRPAEKGDLKLENGSKLTPSVLHRTDPKKYEEESQQILDEIKEEQIKESLVLQAEAHRQKQALAQRLNNSEWRVWRIIQKQQYLHRTETPDSEMTMFRKYVMCPGALENFPEITETISETKPDLFANLKAIAAEHISKAENEDEDEPTVKTGRKRDQPSLPGRFSGPIRVDPDTLIFEKKDTSVDFDEDRKPKSIEVFWNGVSTQVPDEVACHLCKGVMRLCMRKSNYRGELREYPAYRCLRKGCQTFRCVKKQIDGHFPYRAIDYFKTPFLPFNSNITHEKPQSPAKLATPKAEPEFKVPTLKDAPKYVEQKPSTSGPARQKRKCQSKYSTLSRDYLCGNSAAEVAREEEQEDEEEDMGETVSFEYITGSDPLFNNDDIGLVEETSYFTDDWDKFVSEVNKEEVEEKVEEKIEEKVEEKPKNLFIDPTLQKEIKQEVEDVEEPKMPEEKKPKDLLL